MLSGRWKAELRIKAQSSPRSCFDEFAPRRVRCTCTAPSDDFIHFASACKAFFVGSGIGRRQWNAPLAHDPTIVHPRDESKVEAELLGDRCGCISHLLASPYRRRRMTPPPLRDRPMMPYCIANAKRRCRRRVSCNQRILPMPEWQAKRMCDRGALRRVVRPKKGSHASSICTFAGSRIHIEKAPGIAGRFSHTPSCSCPTAACPPAESCPRRCRVRPRGRSPRRCATARFPCRGA